MKNPTTSQSIFQEGVLVIELTVTGFPKQKPNGELVVKTCVNDDDLRLAFIGQGKKSLLEGKYVSISTCRKNPKHFLPIDEYKKMRNDRRFS